VTVDPRTPVIVGVAQIANKDIDRIVHPVELIAEAVEAAVADSGGAPLPRVGKVYATPLSVFSTDDAPTALIERFGLDVRDTFESRYSGASPQRMLADACRSMQDGRLDAALVVGGVAEASVRRARALGIDPPAPPTAMWSQGSTGDRGERRMREGYRPSDRFAEMHTGGQLPVHMFSMLESAIAAAAGRTPTEHRAELGRLMARFTEVAAGHLDLVVEAGLKPVDIVALIPIIEQAGGCVTSWTGGSAIEGGQVVASGDPKLHEAALKLLAR